MKKAIWHGNINTYLDIIEIKTIENVSYGCFGGSTKAGQYTNEDGLYILSKAKEYVLAILLDSHASNESVTLILSEIEIREETIKSYLELPLAQAMRQISFFFIELIHDEKFIEKTKGVRGESAFLVVFQKDNYLWWLSVGDNSLYLLHPELSELGQHRLNQRVFYQWIGEKNSIDLDIPCFTQSTIELRQGKSDIVLLTDGVLECDGQFYDDPMKINNVFNKHQSKEAIEVILKEVESVSGRDSSTIVSWSVDTKNDGLRPTRL